MKLNRNCLILITIFILFIIGNGVLSEQAIAEDLTPDQLTMPINTPNTTTTNIEQIKEYSKNINSVTEKKEKKKKRKKINPAVHYSPNKNSFKEIPAVFIKKVDFGKSDIFSANDLDKFSKTLVNKKVTADDINNLIHTINVNYRKKGYITAKAYLPPQKLKGGVIKIEFIEGKIGEIIVRSNKYTKKSYIIDKFKEKPGDLFKLKVLQEDVNKFNSTNSNIKVFPGLKPGKAIGTTDVYLNTQENFPFHITPSFDNLGRETVGLLRGGLVVSHDSVFGYQDRLSSGTYLGRSSISNFEDYNFPIFNKGTRLGGTFSYSDVSVTSGMYKNMDIKGNTFLYSAYIQQPLIRKNRFTLVSNLSTNFKNSDTKISNIPFTRLDDKSLTASFFAKYIYKHGMIYFSNAFTNGIMTRKLTNNSKWFAKYEGNLTEIHNFKYGITSIFKSMVQLTPHHLESLEQFQLGGMGTVRGFSEGLLLGNNGYLCSEEILFPIPFMPKKLFNYNLRNNIRLAAFVDHGASFPYRGEGVRRKSTDFLTSVGTGLRIKLTRFITARLYWGFGIDSKHQGEPVERFHFDLVSYPF